MLGVQMPLTVPLASFTVPGITLPSMVQVAVCVPPLSENEPLKLIVEPNGYEVSNAGPTLVAIGACVSGGPRSPAPGGWMTPIEPALPSSAPIFFGIG